MQREREANSACFRKETDDACGISSKKDANPDTEIQRSKLSACLARKSFRIHKGLQALARRLFAASILLRRLKRCAARHVCELDAPCVAQPDVEQAESVPWSSPLLLSKRDAAAIGRAIFAEQSSLALRRKSFACLTASWCQVVAETVCAQLRGTVEREAWSDISRSCSSVVMSLKVAVKAKSRRPSTPKILSFAPKTTRDLPV